MAMRGRGGRGNPSRPPRLITGRVYEQFKPMSEWRQEDSYDTLLLYLPGFQKEYIKVTTEDLNIVRVRGERLIADNKWSRFQEDYRVPENCEMRGIRAKFDGGILTVTMPRKTTNAPPPPPPPPPPTTTQLPPRTKEQPFSRPKQEEALPNPKQEPTVKKPEKPKTNPLVEPPPSQVLPSTKEEPFRSTKQEPNPLDLPLQPMATPIKQEPLKPAPEAEEKKPAPLDLPPQPKASSSSTPTKQEEAESIPKHALKQDKRYDVVKPSVGEKTALNKGKEALLEGDTKRELKGTPASEHKKTVAKSWLMNEDRKALVNVGVSVLVIVALGVHVSYSIGLMSKGK